MKDTEFECMKHGWRSTYQVCPFCMIEELKATVAQAEQTAINFHEAWGRYRDALHIIANMGVSGMSWQYDYEKCVNIAKEALEISGAYKVLSRRPV